MRKRLSMGHPKPPVPPLNTKVHVRGGALCGTPWPCSNAEHVVRTVDGEKGAGDGPRPAVQRRGSVVGSWSGPRGGHDRGGGGTSRRGRGEVVGTALGMAEEPRTSQASPGRAKSPTPSRRGQWEQRGGRGRGWRQPGNWHEPPGGCERAGYVPATVAWRTILSGPCRVSHTQRGRRWNMHDHERPSKTMPQVGSPDELTVREDGGFKRHHQSGSPPPPSHAPRPTDDQRHIRLRAAATARGAGLAVGDVPGFRVRASDGSP